MSLYGYKMWLKKRIKMKIYSRNPDTIFLLTLNNISKIRNALKNFFVYRILADSPGIARNRDSKIKQT